MYLPLSGYDPDREKNRRKMSINSVSPTHNPSIVQPPEPIDKTHQRTEKIGDLDKTPNPQKPTPAEEESRVVQHHYSASSMSTQDFMILKTQAADNDQFALLDEVIANIKERTEEMGEFLEAIKKMAESTNDDTIALQILTKTLEAIDEARGEK